MSKFPLYRAIPSLITVAAFICGFNAMRLAILGNIKGAIISIFVAAILDLFDGRIARALKADSKFGAELDSLSDLVCFGVATSLIILFSQNTQDKILYYGTCFFSIASMLRLARFNVAKEYPPYYKNFFIGIPTPAGFFLAILPLCFNYSFDVKISDTMYTIYLIVIGFSLVSIIPTPSTKGIRIPKVAVPFALAVCALLIIGLTTHLWQVLSFLGVAYILSILITIIIFLNKRQKYLATTKTDIT